MKILREENSGRAGGGGGLDLVILDDGLQVRTMGFRTFRCGLVFEAHRLCISFNSRLESNKEEEEEDSATNTLV